MNSFDEAIHLFDVLRQQKHIEELTKITGSEENIQRKKLQSQKAKLNKSISGQKVKLGLIKIAPSAVNKLHENVQSVTTEMKLLEGKCISHESAHNTCVPKMAVIKHEVLSYSNICDEMKNKLSSIPRKCIDIPQLVEGMTSLSLTGRELSSKTARDVARSLLDVSQLSHALKDSMNDRECQNKAADYKKELQDADILFDALQSKYDTSNAERLKYSNLSQSKPTAGAIAEGYIHESRTAHRQGVICSEIQEADQIDAQNVLQLERQQQYMPEVDALFPTLQDEIESESEYRNELMLRTERQASNHHNKLVSKANDRVNRVSQNCLVGETLRNNLELMKEKVVHSTSMSRDIQIAGQSEADHTARLSEFRVSLVNIREQRKTTMSEDMQRLKNSAKEKVNIRIAELELLKVEYEGDKLRKNGIQSENASLEAYRCELAEKVASDEGDVAQMEDDLTTSQDLCKATEKKRNADKLKNEEALRKERWNRMTKEKEDKTRELAERKAIERALKAEDAKKKAQQAKFARETEKANAAKQKADQAKLARETEKAKREETKQAARAEAEMKRAHEEREELLRVSKQREKNEKGRKEAELRTLAANKISTKSRVSYKTDYLNDSIMDAEDSDDFELEGSLFEMPAVSSPKIKIMPSKIADVNGKHMDREAEQSQKMANLADLNDTLMDDTLMDDSDALDDLNILNHRHEQVPMEKAISGKVDPMTPKFANNGNMLSDDEGSEFDQDETMGDIFGDALLKQIVPESRGDSVVSFDPSKFTTSTPMPSRTNSQEDVQVPKGRRVTFARATASKRGTRKRRGTQ